MPRERPIINWDEVPVIIDVPYVARLLAMNPDYVTGLAKANKIPAFKIEKLWRFKKNEIEQYMEEHRNGYYCKQS